MKEKILQFLAANTTNDGESLATTEEVAAGINETKEATFEVLLSLQSEGRALGTMPTTANRMDCSWFIGY